MFFSFFNRLQTLAFFLCFNLAVSFLWPYTALASYPQQARPRDLKERIEFDVRWSFVPLVKTYMETFRLPGGGDSTFYLLTHQAALNTFWNDRMESVIDPVTLLPRQMETIIKDGKLNRKETLLFDRALGKARFVRQGGENGQTIVEHIDISSRSMDPLSAFYYIRRRLSPDKRVLQVKGITGSRRFTMRGELVGEEYISVPAGTFKTYRFECILQSWKHEPKRMKDVSTVENVKTHPFTLWVTQDGHRFPVKIRYRLPLGSLHVRAITLESHDLTT